MEIRQLSAPTPTQPPPAQSQPPKATVPPAVEKPAPPPKGGLPASQQVLSQLTPADRGAIAGATGYHLSPTGAVTNVGGVPPWSFIMAFAASRTAVEPDPDTAKADSSDDGNHVDVTI